MNIYEDSSCFENVPHWTQKDGTKISVLDMTDNHLVNTIKMLERVRNNIGSDIMFNGEVYEHLTIEDLGCRDRCDEWIRIFQTELKFREIKTEKFEMFNELIKDSYRLRKKYKRLCGIMYDAISTIGFDEVSNIEEYANKYVVDMLYLKNGSTDEEIDIYKSNLENYKIDYNARRIYIKLKERQEQSISF